MKLIVATKNKRNFFSNFKIFLRNAIILVSYTLGFSVYALLFLIWTIEWKSDNLYWLLIPLIGFIIGVFHLVFIYKGSLISKAITMFSIMIYVFLMPLVIAMVN